MTRTLRALLLLGAVLVILAWASGCFLAFYIHDDCIDAMNRSSGDREIYAAMVRKCAGSDERLEWVSTWGLAISAAASAGLLWFWWRLGKALQT